MISSITIPKILDSLFDWLEASWSYTTRGTSSTCYRIYENWTEVFHVRRGLQIYQSPTNRFSTLLGLILAADGILEKTNDFRKWKRNVIQIHALERSENSSAFQRKSSSRAFFSFSFFLFLQNTGGRMSRRRCCGALRFDEGRAPQRRVLLLCKPCLMCNAHISLMTWFLFSRLASCLYIHRRGIP